MSRVVCGHSERNSAIRGLQVEMIAVPSFARTFQIDPSFKADGPPGIVGMRWAFGTYMTVGRIKIHLMRQVAGFRARGRPRFYTRTDQDGVLGPALDAYSAILPFSSFGLDLGSTRA